MVVSSSVMLLYICLRGTGGGAAQVVQRHIWSTSGSSGLAVGAARCSHVRPGAEHHRRLPGFHVEQDNATAAG